MNSGNCFKMHRQGIAGRPVVRIPCFHCPAAECLGSIPGQVTKQGCSYHGGLFHTCGLEQEIILEAPFLEGVFPGWGALAGAQGHWPVHPLWDVLVGMGAGSDYNAGDLALIPGLGRSSGGRHGNPLQYSCLESPHRQKSLAGYSPWGGKESDMTVTKHSTLHTGLQTADSIRWAKYEQKTH